MLKDYDGSDMSVMDYLMSYECQFTTDLACGDGLPLVDALTPLGDKTITRGRQEIELIADELEYAIHQLPILEWHSMKNGLPPRPDTQYHTYLVWWSFSESGRNGVPSVVQLRGSDMQFLMKSSFNPRCHHITHWAQIPKPDITDDYT